MTIISSVLAFDQMVNSNTALLQYPLLTKFMIAITTIFSPTVLLFFSALLFWYFWHKKEKNNAMLLSILMLTAVMLTILLKEIIQRARPEHMLLLESGYSFPSGHATIATVFFCYVIYTFYERIKNILLRYVFVAANIFLILLVGFSRIYLQVHWLSDVIGGFSLGLIWFFIIVLLFRRFIPETTTQP